MSIGGEPRHFVLGDSHPIRVQILHLPSTGEITRVEHIRTVVFKRLHGLGTIT